VLRGRYLLSLCLYTARQFFGFELQLFFSGDWQFRRAAGEFTVTHFAVRRAVGQQRANRFRTPPPEHATVEPLLESA